MNRGGGWNAENSQVSDGRRGTGPRLEDRVEWTDERTATLKRLFEDGLSAKDIAHELGGVSRSGVLGKLFRLGLSNGQGCGTGRPKPRIAAKRDRQPSGVTRDHQARRLANIKAMKAAKGFVIGGPRVAPTLICDLPADESQHAVSFHKVREHHCRWPLGNPSDLSTFTFCGDRKGDGPYCARHASLAYRRS